MEDTKKRNIFSRMFEMVKKGWKRLGEPDIDNLVDINDASTAKEVRRIQEVQEQVHEQKGFVPRAKVSERKAQDKVKGNNTNERRPKSLGEY